MTRTERIKAAYAEWAASKGADPGVWMALMGPGFEFRTTLASVAGGGFKACYRRDEIGDYFAALDRTFAMEAMAPTVFIEQGDTVAGLIDAEWTNRATGRSFRSEVATFWTFDGDQASGYRELSDTAGIARTFD
ncbi:MAG: nuclear transport factor 2 family protein [Caulobacter sp.]|nr:nuclear transport factor 2 family protein [Caulobacter sp.]